MLHPLPVETAKAKVHCHSTQYTKHRRPITARIKPMEWSHHLQADKAALAPITKEPTLPNIFLPEKKVVVDTHTATASAASHHYKACPLQPLLLLLLLHQPQVTTAEHSKVNNKHSTTFTRLRRRVIQPTARKRAQLRGALWRYIIITTLNDYPSRFLGWAGRRGSKGLLWSAYIRPLG